MRPEAEAFWALPDDLPGCTAAETAAEARSNSAVSNPMPTGCPPGAVVRQAQSWQTPSFSLPTGVLRSSGSFTGVGSPDGTGSFAAYFNSKLSLSDVASDGMAADGGAGDSAQEHYGSLEEMENETIRGLLPDDSNASTAAAAAASARMRTAHAPRARRFTDPSQLPDDLGLSGTADDDTIFGLEIDGGESARAGGGLRGRVASAPMPIGGGGGHSPAGRGRLAQSQSSELLAGSPGSFFGGSPAEYDRAFPGGAMLGSPPHSGASLGGEHPAGEHPSRTLFVRNINSSVDDDEIVVMFAGFGEIRNLYTACKHRGFVMVSYYDIRGARNAMRALQGRLLRRRKLDIHYSIPKENPSDRDVNQGTLVVFNLDAAVTNDELRALFSEFGEVKEIRETPNKRHHKFVEFFDVRAADAALKGLNRAEVKGKRIKLEPSRPGGARRSLIHGSGGGGGGGGSGGGGGGGSGLPLDGGHGALPEDTRRRDRGYGSSPYNGYGGSPASPQALLMPASSSPQGGSHGQGGFHPGQPHHPHHSQHHPHHHHSIHRPHSHHQEHSFRHHSHMSLPNLHNPPLPPSPAFSPLSSSPQLPQQRSGAPGVFPAPPPHAGMQPPLLTEAAFPALGFKASPSPRAPMPPPQPRPPMPPPPPPQQPPAFSWSPPTNRGGTPIPAQ